MKRVVKKALKQALIEIQDDKKSYFEAYNYWWKRIMSYVESPVVTLKEYFRREDEYEFAVRIANYYAKKYRELSEFEKKLNEVKGK